MSTLLPVFPNREKTLWGKQPWQLVTIFNKYLTFSLTKTKQPQPTLTKTRKMFQSLKNANTYMTLTSDIDLFIYWFCQYFKICLYFCRLGKDRKRETIRCSSQGKSQGERSEGWISISIRWCGRIRNLYGKI